MTYDVGAVRAHFPALREGAAHFDSPGGSQVPDVVGEAVASILTSAISNRGRMTKAERRADDIVVAFRSAVADLLGAEAEGVVYGRSMTQLTYDFSRCLAKGWSPGDEIVVTRLDHDANIRPWLQAAASKGATVRWLPFDPATGELSAGSLADLLSERTRLVALTGASNLIGARPAVSEIAALVHAVGALLYLDGVALTPHVAVDFEALGCDLFVCSPYKFLGPHCGVLAARRALLEELHPDKLLPSSEEVPERFELGTLPYELLGGTTAAVDFLASLAREPGASRRAQLTAAMGGIEEHEERLCKRVEVALASMERVVFHGRGALRIPTLLFTLEGLSPTTVAAQLASLGVNAPAGNFYALEASRWLGLGEEGGVRVGIAPYSDDGDVDRLVAALDDLTRR